MNFNLCAGCVHVAHMLILFLCVGRGLCQQRVYEMDRQSTCNNYIKVYEQDVTLKARSNVAPANPPLECIIYLTSAYQVADGRYRLQMIVEQLQIGDCNVKLDVFNGHGAKGNYLRQLGCSSGSTDIIYTKGREATVRFLRPRDLYQTGYALTLTVKTYADGGDLGTAVGVDTLPTGAIIGIVLGLLLVVALAILLGWCCCTGYIYNFIGRRSPAKTPPSTTTTTTPHVAYMAGSIDSNMEKLSTTSSTQQLNGVNNYQWSSVTGVNNEGNRNFRRGVPRKAVGGWGYTGQDLDPSVDMRSRAVRAVNQGRSYGNYPQEGGRNSHVYEPYDTDAPLDRSPRFRKRQDDPNPRASSRSRESRRSRNSATGDGEGEQEGGKVDMEDRDSSQDEGEVLKKSLDDSDDTEPIKLSRFESEPEVDTIASPMHVNAGVRASVPDLTEQQPPSPSPGHGSPARKTRKGHEPDPMGLPPEAFDPVFTTPTSQEQYPGEWRPLQQAAMPFLPYGVMPMVPGQQTYAYAYQTAPQMGAYPANQGAYFVQSVPTGDGEMQNTAFAMHSSRTPRPKGGKGKGGMGHPGSPEYTSTPEATPEGGRTSDKSLVSPPDPAHRSMAVKSFADPDSGIQTTQVTWTDNVPDPSDPKPGDSSQVTRQTTTRVTTRSGHGDLPPATSTLLDNQEPNPAFLAPSGVQPAPLPPATHTPNRTNVDYYTGQGSAPDRPPEVVHEAPSRNRAIRDRITFGDSTV